MVDELNKKLGEWGGFQDVGSRDKFKRLKGYRYPDGYIYSILPDFTNSLDACSKWLMPSLWICNITLLDGIFWSVEVSIPDIHGLGKHGDGKALNENLTLALCLAIEKLIDGES